MTQALVPPGRIERRIIVIRGENVMLDDDLARIYGVETRVLVQAVKRSARRFPPDFMFQLSREEFEGLRAQLGSANPGRGGRRYLPHAFTEQGVAMLSSVLRSDRAVHVSIEIVRAFVRLRRMAGSVAELRRKLDALEQKYDVQFRMVFDAIRELMAPPAPGEMARVLPAPKSTPTKSGGCAWLGEIVCRLDILGSIERNSHARTMCPSGTTCPRRSNFSV
jgi:hypothetical protein